VTGRKAFIQPSRDRQFTFKPPLDLCCPSANADRSI
jgi:hypothetical protein